MLQNVEQVEWCAQKEIFIIIYLSTLQGKTKYFSITVIV